MLTGMSDGNLLGDGCDFWKNRLYGWKLDLLLSSDKMAENMVGCSTNRIQFLQ